jgi:hypothetical protein
MVKRCIIPDCSLEDDISQFFPFPGNPKLLDRWISKMPLLNLTNFNFKDVFICDGHFNQEDFIDMPGQSKELRPNAVPENFKTIESVNSECCRFCLQSLKDEKFALDQLLRYHYRNLVQEELSMEFPQKFCCLTCHNAIRNSSHIKTKIQEHQIRLSLLPQKEIELEEVNVKVESPEQLDVSNNATSELESSFVKEEENIEPEKTEKKLVDRKRKKKVENHCSICNKDFSNLPCHTYRVHGGTKSLECDHCGKMFHWKREVVNHMRVRISNNNF